MPPYSYPSFEEIEAKEWASNTIETILTDITPVSFQSAFGYQYEKPKKLQIVINEDQPKKKSEYNNPLRRSFSFLEGNLFFTPNEERAQQKNARRSQSTMLPSTSSATKGTCMTPTHQSSLSSRIRDTWHMDYASHIKTEFFTDHKKSSKELKAIHVWKITLAQYMIQTPPSLDIKVKKINFFSLSFSDIYHSLNHIRKDQVSYLNLS